MQKVVLVEAGPLRGPCLRWQGRRHLRPPPCSRPAPPGCRPASGRHLAGFPLRPQHLNKQLKADIGVVGPGAGLRVVLQPREARGWGGTCQLLVGPARDNKLPWHQLPPGAPSASIRRHWRQTSRAGTSARPSQARNSRAQTQHLHARLPARPGADSTTREQPGCWQSRGQKSGVAPPILIFSRARPAAHLDGHGLGGRGDQAGAGAVVEVDVGHLHALGQRRRVHRKVVVLHECVVVGGGESGMRVRAWGSTRKRELENRAGGEGSRLVGRTPGSCLCTLHPSYGVGMQQRAAQLVLQPQSHLPPHLRHPPTPPWHPPPAR